MKREELKELFEVGSLLAGLILMCTIVLVSILYYIVLFPIQLFAWILSSSDWNNTHPYKLINMFWEEVWG